jgi:ribosomal protein S12 methylthiotransferase accessory factor
LLEAVVHGICELVERDGIALWHVLGARGQSERRIDPATIDDPDCRWLLDRFASAGIEVCIWDLTTDVGVATFRVHSVDRTDGFRPALPAGGSGCHPDRAVALARALSEAAQSRVTYISGARDDAGRAAYAERHSFDAVNEARRELEQPVSRSYLDVPTRRADALDEDVAWLLSRLTDAGLRQVIVVDLSDPDMGVAVVRVVIPGLEGLCTMSNYSPGVRAIRARFDG